MLCFKRGGGRGRKRSRAGRAGGTYITHDIASGHEAAGVAGEEDG